jgi:sugar/nucleoside kinase (ribokinase family)
LSWDKDEVWSPAFQVDVVGTVGAGDSAYAGLLTALLKGLPPDQAVRWACAAGACNVEAADATSGVRTWEATQVRMDSGWPTKDIRLPGF